MNPRDPNVQLVEGVASRLGPLKDHFVFVGGLFTDSIGWHLAGDTANQERIPIIIRRLRLIAEI